MKIHTWTAGDPRHAYHGYESKASLLSARTVPAWQRDICIKGMTETQRLAALGAASKALESNERRFAAAIPDAFGAARRILETISAPVEREDAAA